MTTADLLQMRPAVRGDILVGPALTRGAAQVHLVKDPVSGARMEVGPKEHFVIVRLDGTRTLADIGTEYAAQFGTRLGPTQWQQLLRLLSVRQLLGAVPPPRPPAGQAAAPAGPARTGGSLLSGRTRMVADAPALMDRLHDATAFGRRRAVLLPLLALCVALLVWEGVAFGELAHATNRLFDQPVTLCAVGVLLWFSLGAHELAHGVVARAYGLRVAEIGLRRHTGFLTYLYCEVEDVQFLGRRRPQIAIASAGAVMNLVFLLPFWPVWLLLPDRAQAVPFFGGLLLLGTAMGLLNLIPLPPLDGYKALGYALGTLQLATESRTFAVAARSRARRAAYPRRMRAVYGGYAVVCVLLAAALLAALGLACRQTLPGSWSAVSPWLPAAAVALALVLRVLGNRAAARRAARAPATEAAGPRAGAPATPAGKEPHAVPSGPTVPTAPAAAGLSTGTDSAPEALMDKADERPQQKAKADEGPRQTAVELDGVAKSYGEVRALDGVSLSVRQGEFFGILGPNGAGKTTLIEIVEGMRKADAGTVTVFGQSPWPRNIALLRRIGVQTQSSAFFTRLTAWEHLETVAALHGLGKDAARRAIDMVGLADKERSRVDDLSGGQRQRLALATALVHEPDLIFLDEPTAALDPEARRSLWDVLRALRGQGRTIVYTTHYLDEAEALCDRVAIIAGGRVVALDTPTALIRSLSAPARLLVPADRITPDQARAIDGVERVLVEGGEVVIETHAANRVLVAVGEFVDMDAVQTRTATLEDAYLRLTGSEHAR